MKNKIKKKSLLIGKVGYGKRRYRTRRQLKSEMAKQVKGKLILFDPTDN